MRLINFIIIYIKTLSN